MSEVQWPSVVALVVSVLALGLSWMAYRQRVRYHPQPRLEPSWERGSLTHHAIPVQQVGFTNHGDAAARDLVALVPSSARGDRAWLTRSELAPGQSWWINVPLVSGADWGDGPEGNVFIAAEGDERVRPEVVLEWRQAPFAARKRRKRFRGPRLEAP